MNKKLLNEAVGFLVAPLIPVLLLALWNALLYPAPSVLASFKNPELVLFLFYGYLSSAIIGLPLHVYLKNNDKCILIPYLLWGSAIGLLVTIFLFSNLFLWQRFLYGVIGMGYGAVSASIFWFIAVRPFCGDRTPYGG